MRIYLAEVLQREEANLLNAITVQNYFVDFLRDWELRPDILEIKPSGSYAKGTAIRSSADVDLFISLRSGCIKTLEEIYDSLFSFISYKNRNIRLRKQSVSIRCGFTDGTVDLVPAKRNSGSGLLDNDHWLCLRKQRSRQKTNVDIHIATVRNAQRSHAIKLCKAWREKNSFDFPSFYLELVVLEALGRQYALDLEQQLITVLDWISRNLEQKVFMDPANTNNRISDDLTLDEKRSIADRARLALGARRWEDVL